jgi:ketohexokinase
VEVEKPGRDGLQELAMEADIVFYSKTWAQVSSYLFILWQLTKLRQNSGYNSAEECLQEQSSLTRNAYNSPSSSNKYRLTTR